AALQDGVQIPPDHDGIKAHFEQKKKLFRGPQGGGPDAEAEPRGHPAEPPVAPKRCRPVRGGSFPDFPWSPIFGLTIRPPGNSNTSTPFHLIRSIVIVPR